jgi:cellulose synthase/poly-beta-1,6-N-acetylglucosamine synthase-like glycosyltransferase
MNWSEVLFFILYLLALGFYALAMCFILAYGLLQMQLFRAYLTPEKTRPAENKYTPTITVQLPVYNEGLIACRLIDAVCRFDYPSDKLEIQVLDDSTDESLHTTLSRVAYWQRNGVQIRHLHRTDRSGFKAGALKEGLEQATGELIAIFDADFLPDPGFLKKCVPPFQEEKIAVVQTRWAHINRNESLLTQVQALALDMHFSIEQAGRERLGVFLNFNGTAGIWRKKAILDAGNWEADTLTEDLDLSYRAQMQGWKIHFLEEVATPAELPAYVSAIQSQQHRWNKGGAQVASKHLRKIWSGSFPWKIKLHATFHLLNSSVFVALLIVAFSSVVIGPGLARWPLPEVFRTISWVFLLATVALANNFLLAFRKYSGKPTLLFPFYFIAFLLVSMGISLHNGKAVLGGFLGKYSDFIRTPKKGDASNLGHAIRYLRQGRSQTITELVAGGFFIAVTWIGLFNGWYAFALLHGMLGIGYTGIAFTGIWHSASIIKAAQHGQTGQAGTPSSFTK